VADAFVLQTLRTARTKASPRGGIAWTSPVDLLVSLQRELVVDELEWRDGRYGVTAVSGAAGLGVAVLVERVAS
jgi:hypothetical protein